MRRMEGVVGGWGGGGVSGLKDVGFATYTSVVGTFTKAL